jgi:hypothetical protein
MHVQDKRTLKMREMLPFTHCENGEEGGPGDAE